MEHIAITTQNLEDRLKRYQSFKISLSIEEFKQIAKEDKAEEILLKKLKLDTKNNYHIFSYIRNKNKEIILAREDKVFFNFKKNPISYLRYKSSKSNISKEISQELDNYNLHYNHEIDLFIIPTKYQILKNSTEIYLLIKYNLDNSLQNSVENIYAEGILSRIADLIYDAYTPLKNNIYKIIIFLILYLVIYYTLVLRTIGIPFDSISEYNLLASIKNYTTAGGMVLFPVLLILLVFIHINSPKYSRKNYNLKILKVCISFITYYLLFSFLYSYSLFTLSTKNIKYNDPIIVDYFQSTFYPRVISTDKNDTVLAINESNGGYYYYYSIDNLYNNIDKTYCEEVNKDNIKLEEFTISILKNAGYTSAKNITKNKLKNHSFYDKNVSINYFITKTKEICDSNKNKND